MSEFSDESALKRFLGDAVDPVGFLGDQIRRTKGQRTLLFDEIEKANKALFDLLLQILDAGLLTFYNKTTVALGSYYIVCTSNIGTSRLVELPKATASIRERIVREALEQSLRPELLGRFSRILVFDVLPFEIQKSICRLMVDKELQRLQKLGFSDNITCSEEAIQALALGGFTTKCGARYMKDYVQSQIGECIVQSQLQEIDPKGRLVYSTQNSAYALSI